MNFPIIETKKIILRELIEEDSNALFDIYSNKKAMKYWDSEIHNNISVTIEMTRHMIKTWYSQKGISWGIFLKNSQKLVGQFSIHSWNKN